MTLAADAYYVRLLLADAHRGDVQASEELERIEFGSYGGGVAVRRERRRAQQRETANNDH